MGYYVTAGKRYGQWTALGEGDRYADMVLCRCDCGNERRVKAYRLYRGESQKCKSCAARSTNRGHGLSSHPLYGTWSSMIARCHNHNATGYKNYGARGIYVCERWRNHETGLQAFIDDMGPKPIPVMSLERTDNDGPYCPENCSWAMPSAQTQNQRKPVPNSLYDELKAENAALQAQNDLLLRRLAQLTSDEEYW